MSARLNSRTWVLVGAMTALLIMVVAWLIVISPVRSDAGQLRDDTAGVDTQNVVLQGKNNKLSDQAKHQHQLVAQLDVALAGLPSGAGLPVFSRQLATQASTRGVVLTGVTIGTPAAPVSATPAAPVDPNSTEANAAADGIATAPTATAPTTAGVQSIPITVTSTGSVLQQLLFLRDVQQTGPRLALITSTSLAPAPGAADGGSIDDAATMTLQLSVFTNPLPKATRAQLAGLTESADAS